MSSPIGILSFVGMVLGTLLVLGGFVAFLLSLFVGCMGRAPLKQLGKWLSICLLSIVTGGGVLVFSFQGFVSAGVPLGTTAIITAVLFGLPAVIVLRICGFLGGAKAYEKRQAKKQAEQQKS